MKRTLLVFILLMACIATLLPANAASFSLNNQNMTMFKGDKMTLTIDGVDSSKVTWKSNNKNIATVTKKGVVTARKAGTAVITGVCNSIKFRCKITVQNIKKLNTLLYSGEYGKLWLKEINSKGFVIKYNNTTEYDIWLMSEYYVLDGRQLEYMPSEDVDSETGYSITYNYFDMVVPKGWSKTALMYIKNPSIKSKKFSGFIKVNKYKNSEGTEIGTIVFKDVKIQ